MWVALGLVLAASGCDAPSPETGDAGARPGEDDSNFTAPPLRAVPGWSLEEALVVFEADVEGNLEIFMTTGRDASTARRLTSSPGVDRHARWAPTGDWLVFESERAAGAGSREFDLWGLQLSSDGMPAVDAVPLPVAASPALEEDAAISPDGSRVAFYSERTGADVPDGSSGHLWLTNAPGRGGAAAGAAANGEPEAAVRVTREPIPFSGGVAWHPDGQDLFISRGRGATGPRDILLISVDGTRERTLVSTGFPNHDPTPSPDGGSLAWVAAGPDGPRVMLARIDGSGARAIATGRYRLTVWTPDQAWLVADRIDDTRTDVYLIPVSGEGEPERLFRGDRPTSGAAFRPWIEATGSELAAPTASNDSLSAEPPQTGGPGPAPR